MAIYIPKEFVLSFFLPRNAFMDWQSKEDSTQKVKGKYKLLFKRHKVLGVYLFFTLTSDHSSCVQERRVDILYNDWESRIGSHLDAKCSYLDVQKCNVLTESEVLEKAKRPSIGMELVGKVTQLKFSEIKLVLENYLLSGTKKTDFKVRDTLKQIVLEDGGGFISKFGI